MQLDFQRIAYILLFNERWADDIIDQKWRSLELEVEHELMQEMENE